MEVLDMAGTQTKKRLIIELPPEEHRAIKARALMRGISLREYVLEKLRADQNPDEDEYDMEDLTESIKQGLREVAAYQRGEIELPTFDEFIKELEDEKT